MEDWEVKLRIKCDRELDNGLYEIGGPGMKAFTGKGGYTEYLVAMERGLRGEVDRLDKQIKENPPQPVQELKPEYKNMSEKEFKKILEDTLYTLNK